MQKEGLADFDSLLGVPTFFFRPSVDLVLGKLLGQVSKTLLVGSSAPS